MKVTRKSTGEVIRFGLVGFFATFLHYSIYWLLRQWTGYNVAYAVGYGLSFVCNFFLTAYFTFRKKATMKRGIGFGGVHLFNLLFQMLLLNLFVGLGIKQSIAPLFVFGIAIPVQFLLVRYVFKKDV